MNPGLAVKLRPTGPWRIGPDSGARNRVDAIYHSDSLYSAVTSAMARMGSLDDWLDATARASRPAVSFSSCFPFVEEIGFVVPPRTVWPPVSPALLSARVRWKSAKFVPLGIVQAILAGSALDENHWVVDGPSGCLMPVGRLGPFRAGVRWSAAIDRLSGSPERHSVACTEFRPGAGLWTVVSFADEAGRDRWQDPVKTAFRWLADSGFGGERSRGWGRAEMPEFVEGTLPELIIGAGGAQSDIIQPSQDRSLTAASPATLTEPAPLVETGSSRGEEGEAVLQESELQAAGSEGTESQEAILPAESSFEEPVSVEQRAPVTTVSSPTPALPFWLLSVFAPASGDAVDWGRGNYSLVTRGGRIESAAGSGELKKQLPMVAEGSVLFASAAPLGSAPDVAPDGFAHPVFRAGFAVAIPLPEVS